MTRVHAVQLAAAGVAGIAIGYLSHRPASRVVYRDRVEYKDRVQVVEKVVEKKGDTITVAGPVRTEIRRVLVQVPGQPLRCEETVTTERAPVVVQNRTEALATTDMRTQVVTRVETKTVPAPLPRWQLEARAGLGAGLVPLAGLGGARCWGPLCAGVWADAAVAPVRPRSAGVSFGLRF